LTLCMFLKLNLKEYHLDHLKTFRAM
jgi:hypothetical protein